ncbi:MAG: PIN domain-containing protein [Cyclobacteriaceae bacterium]
MKVLADTSVWVEYFRTGSVDQMDQLLEEDLIVTNDIILTELIPALALQKQTQVIESLTCLNLIPLQIDWELIRRYQRLNLENGINKVGIPDLIILQQTIEHSLILFSLDKHFRLMSNHYDFKLV